MSEAMFQGFQVCYGAAAQLLYALALTIFCAPFLGEGRRGRKAAVFLLYLAGWLICDGLALPHGSFCWPACCWPGRGRWDWSAAWPFF